MLVLSPLLLEAFFHQYLAICSKKAREELEQNKVLMPIYRCYPSSVSQNKIASVLVDLRVGCWGWTAFLWGLVCMVFCLGLSLFITARTIGCQIILYCELLYFNKAVALAFNLVTRDLCFLSV